MHILRHLFLPVLMIVMLGSIGCAAGVPPVPTTPESEFTPLFDGASLDGWRVVGGDATFRVENGEIVGVCDNTRANTFLRTDKTYRDFEFRAQFRWDQPSNSGIQFRSHQRPSSDEVDPGRVYGYQFELDPTQRAWSGGLYEEGRRGWIVKLEGEDNLERRAAVKLNGWNDVVIECRGNRIRTWLNGVSIVNHEDADTNWALAEGFFALQVHSGGSGAMRWRNLRLMELDE